MMNVVVQFTMEEEDKALPILFRHSPGQILRGRVYIVDVSAAQTLRNAGITFRTILDTNLPDNLMDDP
jgi:hypothetical protein